ncbi:MAG: hypothetical protein ACT4OG_09745 [Alphaproteobacteria bacterium]
MMRNFAAMAVLAALLFGPALASAAELAGEGQTPGSKVVVTSLKRDAGGTVTLRFQIANDGDADVKTYGVLGQFFTTDKVTLIDAANKKKYLAIKDDAGTCLCSELKGDVVKGSRFNLWVKFPAPPADVNKITVIVPSFEPVEVPITAAAP